ncbi:MAG: S8 family serine peptidase [Candidatus Polarisedimenticolia bacterium]
MTPATPPVPPKVAPHLPGELLVRFKDTAHPLDRASARALVRAAKLRGFRNPRLEHWRLDSDVPLEQALEKLKKHPRIEYAEPNYILTVDLVPDDPRMGELHGMINTGQNGGTPDADIDADQAWDIVQGSRDVLVAIIDTGIDYDHPDLAANIWTNPGEIPGNGVDDDGNGFVDDVHGYDFANDDGDPFDDHGHGTHVAGTIGAVGNNGIGVVGVCWEVSLMAIKYLSADGSGATDKAVRAVEYTTMMGAHLTSNSWGGGAFSQALYEAIAEAGAAGIAFVAAAGNDGTSNDAEPHYPSSYDLPNVIAVAATDPNDAVPAFSNWGATTVDLAAPGVNILSTGPGNTYRLLSGTSMAAPHVSGAAALLKSRFPFLGVAEIKFALMNLVDRKPALHPFTGTRPVAGGGRLNVSLSTADLDEVPPGAVRDLAVHETGSNHARLTWTAPGDDGAEGTATSYQIRYATSPIDEASFAKARPVGNSPSPGQAGTPGQVEVPGLDADTTWYFALKALDEWGNAGPLSNVAVAATQPPPTAGHAPASIRDALMKGETSDHAVTLRNDGVGTLDFTLQPLEITRPAVLDSGGPNAGGYLWRDSDEPGGPEFGWVDIRNAGTLIAHLNSDNQNSGPVPIGFPFPFYGNTFTTVNVTTNGFLSFTSLAFTRGNGPLPSDRLPPNLLAVFFDDLHFAGGGRAYYHNDGSRFIVQWNDVDRDPAEDAPRDHLTFQAILYPNGYILYQYLTLDGPRTSATVGIQDGTRTDGLTVVFNSAYLRNRMAVEFNQGPRWLTASPTSGRIPAGGSSTLGVALNAAGLEDGLHEATLEVSSNDPGAPVLRVPVSLTVGLMEVAWLDFSPGTLNLSSNRTRLKLSIELPAGFDPRGIDPSSIRLNGTIPALPFPFEYTDQNRNGVEEVVVRFDPARVQPTLPEGNAVPISVKLALTGGPWFRGTTTIRTKK